MSQTTVDVFMFGDANQHLDFGTKWNNISELMSYQLKYFLRSISTNAEFEDNNHHRLVVNAYIITHALLMRN